MPKASMQSTSNSFWSSWIKIKHEPLGMKDTITNTSSNIRGYSFNVSGACFLIFLQPSKTSSYQGDENSPSVESTDQPTTNSPHLEELIDGWTPAPNNGRLAAPGLHRASNDKKHHMKKKPRYSKSRNDKKPRYSKKQLINLWILKYLKIAPPFSHDSHDQPTADQSLDQIFSAQG